MSELRCFYHPNIVANDKCDRCGKLLCLNCKIVVHSSGSEGGGHRYVFCPECNEKRKRVLRIGLIIVIPTFFILVLIILLIAFS